MKMEMLKKEELKELKKAKFEELNDLSKDFVNNYDIENIYYFSDSLNEFSDSQIDIYYYDLKEWLKKENSFNYIEMALNEFGFNSNDTFYKIIQNAQYLENQEELNENQKEILSYLVSDFIYRNYEEISKEFYFDFIYDTEFDYLEFDNLNNFEEDFKICYQEYLEEMEENIENEIH